MSAGSRAAVWGHEEACSPPRPHRAQPGGALCTLAQRQWVSWHAPPSAICRCWWTTACRPRSLWWVLVLGLHLASSGAATSRLRPCSRAPTPRALLTWPPLPCIPCLCPRAVAAPPHLPHVLQRPGLGREPRPVGADGGGAQGGARDREGAMEVRGIGRVLWRGARGALEGWDTPGPLRCTPHVLLRSQLKSSQSAAKLIADRGAGRGGQHPGRAAARL